MKGPRYKNPPSPHRDTHARASEQSISREQTRSEGHCGSRSGRLADTTTPVTTRPSVHPGTVDADCLESPINFENMLYWYECVCGPETGKFSTVSMSQGTNQVHVYLPICDATALVDLCCHTAYCLQRLISEMEEDNSVTLKTTVSLFRKTLYGSCASIWRKAFPDSSCQYADYTSLMDVFRHFLSHHGIFAGDESGLGRVALSLKNYLIGDVSQYRKPRSVPTSKVTWALEHMKQIYSILQADDGKPFLTDIEMEQALLYTMPDTWFNQYIDERDSLQERMKNKASTTNTNGMFYIVASFYEKQESLSSRKLKEVAASRRHASVTDHVTPSTRKSRTKTVESERDSRKDSKRPALPSQPT